MPPPVRAVKPLLESISNRQSPGKCSGRVSPPGQLRLQSPTSMPRHGPFPITQQVLVFFFFSKPSPPLLRRLLHAYCRPLTPQRSQRNPMPLPDPKSLHCSGPPDAVGLCCAAVQAIRDRYIVSVIGKYQCSKKIKIKNVDYPSDKPTCHPWPDFRGHSKINATPGYVRRPCHPGACTIKSVRRDVTSGQSAERRDKKPRMSLTLSTNNSHDGIE